LNYSNVCFTSTQDLVRVGLRESEILSVEATRSWLAKCKQTACSVRVSMFFTESGLWRCNCQLIT